MIFDAGRSITWASGRGLGPGNLKFFGTHLLARCHFTGLKKLSISRAQPPPSCPCNGATLIKNITHRVGWECNCLCVGVYGAVSSSVDKTFQ